MDENVGNEKDEHIQKVIPCPLQCHSIKCKAYKPAPKIDTFKTPIIWVLGGPGIGKATQCVQIAERYGFLHLSLGSMLRQEAAKESENSKLIRTIVEKGGLVPTDIVLDLLKTAMLNNAHYKGFLVAGFPREASQSVAFEREIAVPTGIIFFDARRETLIRRIKHRIAATTKQFDDSAQTVMNRIQNFYAHIDRILEQHANKFERINAEGPKEAVFQEVVRIMDMILARNNLAAEMYYQRLADQLAREKDEQMRKEKSKRYK